MASFRQLLKSMGNSNNNAAAAPSPREASPAPPESPAAACRQHSSSSDLGGLASAAVAAVAAGGGHRAAARALGVALAAGPSVTFDACAQGGGSPASSSPTPPPQLESTTVTVYVTDGGAGPHRLAAATSHILAYGLATGAVRLLGAGACGGAKALAKGVHGSALSDLAFAAPADAAASPAPPTTLLASAGRDGTVGVWEVSGASAASVTVSRLAAVDLVAGGGGGTAASPAARLAWHPSPPLAGILALGCGGGEEAELMLSVARGLPGGGSGDGPAVPLSEAGASEVVFAVPLAGCGLPAPAGACGGLAWAPDGSALAAAFGSHALLAWAGDNNGTAHTQASLRELAEDCLGPSATAWAPHGEAGPLSGLAWVAPRLLVSAGGEGEVSLWEVGGAGEPKLLQAVSIREAGGAPAGHLAALTVLPTGVPGAPAVVAVSAPGRARVYALAVTMGAAGDGVSGGPPARFGAAASFTVASPVLSASLVPTSASTKDGLESLLAVHADAVRLLTVDAGGCAATGTEGGAEAGEAGATAGAAAEEALQPRPPAPPPPLPRLLTPSQLVGEASAAAAESAKAAKAEKVREAVVAAQAAAEEEEAKAEAEKAATARAASAAAAAAAKAVEAISLRPGGGSTAPTPTPSPELDTSDHASVKAESVRAATAADAMAARLAAFEADQREAWKRTKAEVKREVTAAVSAALAAATPVVARAAAAGGSGAAAPHPAALDPAALASALSSALPAALASPAARAAMEGALASSVSRALPAAVEAGLASALQPSFKAAFEEAIIPRFEAAVREMFQQVQAAFSGGLSEHLSGAAGASAAAAASLKDTVDRAAATVERASGVAKSAELAAGDARAAAAVASAALVAAAAAPPPPPSPPAQPTPPPPPPPPPAYVDPATRVSAALTAGDYEGAFTAALDEASPALLAAVTAAVPASEAAPGLSQPVLLTLLQQLGVGLASSADPAHTVGWVREAALALDPRDPALAAHVRPILSGVLEAAKGVASGGGPAAGEARLALHVVNSVLHQCG